MIHGILPLMEKIDLPIDPYIPDIQKALRTHNCLIIQAEPGAGKTTRVPPALLSVVKRKVLVLEPRRLAARLSAERIASALGEKCGQTVGYQIRFETVESQQTRLKFITEGLLVRYLMADPALSDIDCVVLDEFHERHIQTDVALALVRHLQQTRRRDLKLVIMSATLPMDSLKAALPDALVLVSEGVIWPVEIEYLEKESNQPLEVKVARAVTALFASPNCPGHLLVFLPGAAEIRKSAAQLESLAQREAALLLELRSEIPWGDQVKVFAPTARRKIILATNIAETSVTIEGVTGVVDSGLARIAGHATWSGLPTLDLQKVSQASCIQRAGRAGRTGPGITKRLYTPFDFSNRPPFEKAEIQRTDLTQLLLDIKVIATALSEDLCFEKLAWLDPPPEKTVQSCFLGLQFLGALDESGRLTAVGRDMARFPIQPRLARIIVEGAKRKQGAHSILAAALIAEGLLKRTRLKSLAVGYSDVTYQMELYLQLRQGQQIASALREQLDRARISRIDKLSHHLFALAGINEADLFQPISEEGLSEILLTGYPDRVAKLRQGDKREIGQSPRGLEYNLCLGGGAILTPMSVVKEARWLLAIEAEEQARAGNSSSAAQIRVACQISEEALILGNSCFTRTVSSCEWDSDKERVKALSRLYYGELILEESVPPIAAEEYSHVLEKALKNSWPRPFSDLSCLADYQERCAIVLKCGVDFEFPDFTGGGFEGLLKHICRAKKSFAQIAARELSEYLKDLLSGEARRLLNDYAPSHITAGDHRKMKVHYEPQKPPWISSRLQDFLGTTETPKIGRGQIPLVIHLLAPNQRPIQITTDLKSFWEKVYPELKNQLSRRYPRHAWPDDPKTAKPPRPKSG